MYHFCTITTADHLFKTLALFDSIRALRSDAFLHVLCIDDLPTGLPSDHIAFYKPQDLAHLPSAKTIIAKYASSKDKLRWSLKPVFLHYLLTQSADKIIYVDNDIYFYGDYSFLFALLGTYDFLLTPHHYPRDPGKDQNWLEANFRVGLYNAGFVGVNKNAIKDLDWWAACCAYRCEKNALRGTFDDQKYLDLIPVINEKAHIIRHKGCNVAEWNRAVISRSEEDGRIILDNEYPLIFIHFNGTTIRAIVNGEEPFLTNSFDSYIANLKRYKPAVQTSQLYKNPGAIDRLKYSIWKLATNTSM
ncbi:MAG: hypothetical protein JWO03_3161 [Bacteroidetes bacterium]|nr:hypothetical protein [Bacteroidota bacterium]